MDARHKAGHEERKEKADLAKAGVHVSASLDASGPRTRYALRGDSLLIAAPDLIRGHFGEVPAFAGTAHTVFPPLDGEGRVG